jgi:2-dehydro-3-deoxy-D-arabinonate dehydratase
MPLWRVRTAQGERWARGGLAAGPTELLDPDVTLDGLLARGDGAVAAAASGEGGGEPVPAGSTVLAPVQGQEVWAAGVTFATSRAARNEESGGHDFYDQVYAAERPELFFKAAPGRVRGPGTRIGVRADSGWDVPEAELALVLDASGAIVAYTIGNDVSSRSIEGENPLYLPQAKVYRGSCALGPCLVPVAEAPAPEEMEITLRILRDGAETFAGATQVALLRRTPEELAGWLFRAQDFAAGAVLLTGTSIIPAPEFTLRAGDEVRIAITGLGELVNAVEVVGAT